ncbi:MAG: hypothetical protein IPI26_05775 [Elusimicrobia bacterium]|nr:hypothetical protein [Elusimicrobiota bacterium]
MLDVAGVGYRVALGASRPVARLPPDGREVRLLSLESTAMYGGAPPPSAVFLSEDEAPPLRRFPGPHPQHRAKKPWNCSTKPSNPCPIFTARCPQDPAALVGLFGFTAKTAEKIGGRPAERSWTPPSRRAGRPLLDSASQKPSPA